MEQDGISINKKTFCICRFMNLISNKQAFLIKKKSFYCIIWHLGYLFLSFNFQWLHLHIFIFKTLVKSHGMFKNSHQFLRHPDSNLKQIKLLNIKTTVIIQQHLTVPFRSTTHSEGFYEPHLKAAKHTPTRLTIHP